MRLRKAGRPNPACYTNQANKPPEMASISLTPLIEENATGNGLHCISPEEYFLWVERMQNQYASEGVELYWD
jgi:hypothetical protein